MRAFEATLGHNFSGRQGCFPHGNFKGNQIVEFLGLCFFLLSFALTIVNCGNFN